MTQTQKFISDRKNRKGIYSISFGHPGEAARQIFENIPPYERSRVIRRILVAAFSNIELEKKIALLNYVESKKERGRAMQRVADAKNKLLDMGFTEEQIEAEEQ